MKEKQLKEIFSLLAGKINSAITSNNLLALEDLLTEKTQGLAEVMKAYDWQALDKKTQESLNRVSLFYLDLLKHRYQITRKKLTRDYLRNLFDYYRKHYLDLLAENELSGMSLTKIAVYQIFEDYFNAYSKLILCNEGRKGTLDMDIEDYWEMPSFIFENISLTSVETMNLSNDLDVLKNTNLFLVIAQTFKAKVVESRLSLSKAGVFECVLDNIYNGRLLDLGKYYDMMKKTSPLVFFEIVIEEVVVRFIKEKEFSAEFYKENIVKLLQAWDFMKTVKKFTKRTYDLGRINKTYGPTLRSLVILLLLSCFKSLNSECLKMILTMLDLEAKDYEYINYSFILEELEFPFLTDLSEEFSKEFVAKAAGLMRKKVS
eukprot:CAMPEP_0170517250 /NCGR_PEP_ID=MMETSP0209-20121228/3286_1 /TAXON_ID=665100 ORGANISM="Litonotus pictus, Strain P1" /NCGR_SAMPLE_ID=MMETSP0209 /ASSEMBLY_ACC=CAM_ASM_000301 /LENGTH=373 /DNA_ID=CAMNT_0010802437 /DNA_START=102 /DNA_END=1220 /DNA_ORIENTATION=-